MNRIASVVSQNNHTVTLQLKKQQKCAGCPSNCNEPLFKLFSVANNRFDLSSNNSQYHLIDSENLLNKQLHQGQMLKLLIDDSDLLVSSVMLYLLPLLLCLIGTTLGHYGGKLWALNTDLSALMGLLLGLLVVVVVFRNKMIKKHLKFRPKVTILSIKGT